MENKKQPKPAPPTKQELSDARMKKLEHEIITTIDRTSKRVKGEFTVFEVNRVLLRTTYSYNQRGLDFENGVATMMPVKEDGNG